MGSEVTERGKPDGSKETLAHASLQQPWEQQSDDCSPEKRGDGQWSGMSTVSVRALQRYRKNSFLIFRNKKKLVCICRSIYSEHIPRYIDTHTEIY